jgi:hypothetical protein
VVATAGLVTAVWLPTRNDSADAAERDRSSDSRRDRERVRSLPAFADEFSGRRGSTVDPAKWALRTDRADRDVQFSPSTRNARLDGDGNLVIVLRGEDGDNFSTARLYSKNTLRGTTGRVEARIKAPGGEGLQPAFELVTAGRTTPRALNVLADPVTDGEFHTYAVDFRPGEAVLSVDGTQVKREDLAGVDTGRPFRLALTLGVDDDRDRADLPARMVVDSVSFSGADASAEPTTPPATTPPATAPTTEPPADEPPTSEPPAPEPTTPPTTAPTTTPPAATTPPTTPPTSAPAAAAWAPFTDYVAGQLVTFKGVEYQVQETHTSLPGWEPTALPALFKKI